MFVNANAGTALLSAIQRWIFVFEDARLAQLPWISREGEQHGGAACPHAGGARAIVTCACQGSYVWYLIYRGKRLINIDDFITFCDAILVH